MLHFVLWRESVIQPLCPRTKEYNEATNRKPNPFVDLFLVSTQLYNEVAPIGYGTYMFRFMTLISLCAFIDGFVGNSETCTMITKTGLFFNTTQSYMASIDFFSFLCPPSSWICTGVATLSYTKIYALLKRLPLVPYLKICAQTFYKWSNNGGFNVYVTSLVSSAFVLRNSQHSLSKDFFGYPFQNPYYIPLGEPVKIPPLPRSILNAKRQVMQQLAMESYLLHLLANLGIYKRKGEKRLLGDQVASTL